MSVNITMNGSSYELATTLRVAYMIQGQHNHKPYTEVFKDIGEMGVEEQIDILYAAFACANKDVMTKQAFRDYYLDHINLKELVEQLQAVIKGITGDIEPVATNADAESASGN